jgi:hypothetical protein
VTHYSHTHTAGNHTHSDLQHANLYDHVKPLAYAADPKKFGGRRDFANKTAFQSAQRRSEGAIQFDGPAIVRPERRRAETAASSEWRIANSD